MRRPQQDFIMPPLLRYTVTQTLHQLLQNFLSNFCQSHLQKPQSMYDNVHDAVRREKPMEICQASWCYRQDAHQALPAKPVPLVYLYHIIHHCYQNKCLIHIPVYLSMSRPQQLPQFTASPVHIMQASKCHHMHSFTFLHSPSSSKVHTPLLM